MLNYHSHHITNPYSLFLVFVSIFGLALQIEAQPIQGIPYQAVIRNSSGSAITNQALTIKCSILDSTATGVTIYDEIHSATTNSSGLIAITIGAGTSNLRTFDGISWGQNDKYLKIEIDTTGTGSNYIELNTQKMMSVPYALFADNGIPPGGNEGQVLGLVNGKPQWINSTATFCNLPDIFNPNKAYGNLTDQDGNVYKTIVIGNQEWMAENLKVGHFKNGDTIPNITDNNTWSNQTIGSLCTYNDSTNFECPYGKLYNWFTISDARGVCPLGWHVPNESEWNSLVDYLDNAADTAQAGFQSASAGGKLKSTGINWWLSPNVLSDNSSGFSGVGAGYRNSSGGYENMLDLTNWWSSEEFSGTNAYYRSLFNYNGGFFKDNHLKSAGFSIRCIKDH
jgi:uncharacterized protein (TIGR02145 family)